MDPLLCSGGVYADDSSLGLGGIKWVIESCGKFFFVGCLYDLKNCSFDYFLMAEFRATLWNPLILACLPLGRLSVETALASADLLDSHVKMHISFSQQVYH